MKYFHINKKRKSLLKNIQQALRMNYETFTCFRNRVSLLCGRKLLQDPRTE